MARLPPPSETHFLDPAVIARLGSLELKARTIVEGFLTGLHRSPFKGFSVEFAEYRQYMPGDDLSTIDWKVYARSDRHYVKKYEEDTNLDCHLLLDVSRSMGYGSGTVTKLEYASYLTAALAYLMQRQRDAVGLMLFDERIVDVLPARTRSGHFHSILLALERVQPGQRTDVSQPLHLLAEALGKRGMVILVSDLFDEPERVIDGLKHFRFKGTDVIVFHVLDHAELTFPFERATRFRDLESDDEVMAVPSLVREQYLREIQGLVDKYKKELQVVGIDYCLLDTSQPLDFALMQYLSTRRKSM
jgi:uncharacterized protein (DUF58 family)